MAYVYPSSSSVSGRRVRGQWFRIVEIRWIEGDAGDSRRGWDGWSGRDLWLWYLRGD